MATATGVQIDTEERSVHIRDLTIHDDDLVEFLTDFEEDEREMAVEQALLIGANTLEFASTSKDLEFVKSEFRNLQDAFEDELEAFEEEIGETREELNDKLGDDGTLSRALDHYFDEDGTFERRIEKAFGEDGVFASRLDEELGEDGEKIQKALDPDREGTPTYRLKQRLLNEIEGIRDELKAEEGREEIRAESWHKGADFEDQLESLLDDIVNQTPHRLRNTSDETGQLQDCKKGDFVVDLGELDRRIVIEAKHGHFNGTVEDEMTEAIENRDADFGILVAQSIEYLPRTKVGWFSEIDQEFIVVALSGPDDDEIEPRFLNFAFHWARTRTMLSSVGVGDDIDMETVRSELESIERSIEDFSQIRSKCTNIENATESIRGTLAEMERDIEDRLGTIQQELRG